MDCREMNLDPPLRAPTNSSNRASRVQPRIRKEPRVSSCGLGPRTEQGLRRADSGKKCAHGDGCVRPCLLDRDSHLLPPRAPAATGSHTHHPMQACLRLPL